MKTLRVMAVVFAVLVFSIASLAQAAPYDIKGDVLGSSIDTFKAKYRHVPKGDPSVAPYCESKGSGLDECQVYFRFEKIHAAYRGETIETIANCPADLEYSFVDGTLWMIAGIFQQRDFQTVETAFVEKFGAPKTKTVKQYQNAFGAQFSGAVEEWDNGVSHIVLLERTEDLDNSGFSVTHTALSDIVKRRIPKPKSDL